MTAAETVALLRATFPDAVTGEKLEVPDPWVVVDPAKLVEVAKFLRDDPRLKFEILSCITGIDYLETDPKKLAKAGFEPHLEVVYHLQSFSRRCRFVVKLMLPRWKDNIPGQLPEVPSLAEIWPAADWHEREVFDLCGVRFLNHPGLERILMSEDWEGHPLRKDYEFPLEYHGIRCR